MKKKYKIILWDIDDTLIDFKATEAAALSSCFMEYGVKLSTEDVAIYSKINHDYWKLLEQGKAVKSEMLVQRFRDFATYLNITNIDGEAINLNYQLALGDYVMMYDYAMELCQELKGQVKQYAVTNGTAIAQQKKLSKTGLIDVFDGIFISDEVGYQKPDVRFFEHCFAHIPEVDLASTIIIGDSLTSDMRGGNLMGIDCCWFNHRGEQAPQDIILAYEVHSIEEIRNVLL